MDSNSVNHAFANMYLHHVEKPAVAIKEMYRILKSGGKLVLTDLDEHNFEYLKTEHNDRWMGFDRSDIKAWFSEAGFKNVKVDCVGETCDSTSTCGGEAASISIFIASKKSNPLSRLLKRVVLHCNDDNLCNLPVMHIVVITHYFSASLQKNNIQWWRV